MAAARARRKSRKSWGSSMKGSEEFWEVFSYEVQMYWATREFLGSLPHYQSIVGSQLVIPVRLLTNAVVESRVIHTRILADIFLEKASGEDDIKLAALYPEWHSDAKLTELVEQLSIAYGNSRTEGTPCWVFNKKVAHPTKGRTDRYDYKDTFRKVDPLLRACIIRLCELRPDNNLLTLFKSES